MELNLDCTLLRMLVKAVFIGRHEAGSVFLSEGIGFRFHSN